METDINERSKLFKAQKSVLTWLLGFIYASFICSQLGEIQAITDYNFSLHELLYFPVYISLFVVPILFLIYVYFFVKYLVKREKKGIRLKVIIQSIAIVMSLIAISIIIFYQSNEVSTGVIGTIESKFDEDGKYYIVFENQKIRVSKNEFQLIEVNKEYFINYISNTKMAGKAKLQTIEPLK